MKIMYISFLIFEQCIMWQVLMGFGAGVYVGTVYDCKPTINFLKECIKKTIPEDAIPKKKE